MSATPGSGWSDAPQLVIRALDNPVTLLASRLCVAAPFIGAGILKLVDWQAGVAEMAHAGLSPAWLFNLAVLLTELGGSVLVVLNYKLWLGAGALGVFTVLSTFLAHRFWELDGQARVMQFNSFLEHATISAAFILVTVVGLRRGTARS